MLVRYTDKVKGGHKMKMLPFIEINPKYKNDKGLHAHEYEHVKQYFMLGIPAFIICLLLSNWLVAVIALIATHDVLYTFIRGYRQWCEVTAFRKQLKMGGDIYKASHLLASGYDLSITEKQAYTLLSKK
jgi:hypothetical protein